VTRRLLIIALNYAPDLTGIGKYVSEMTEWLAANKQLSIRVIAAPPYYPAWKVHPDYSSRWYRKEHLAGAQTYRCPVWVPRAPTALTRLLHLLSFAASGLPLVLWQAISWRPHVILTVEPPLCAAPSAWLAARLCGARACLHVQDLEVDAAFDLGMIRSAGLRRFALSIERWLMRRFDQVSTISERMRAKILDKGVDQRRVFLFPNWVDMSSIAPMLGANRLRDELGIAADARVLLYSGNMGEKQGLEIIIEAARRFTELDTVFLMCGDGVAQRRLKAAAATLTNVQFIALQPRSRLNELLNLADIHLLPQRSAAEDAVMPSKLTAIMASGRPVVATASSGSDVARISAQGGLVVPPGDVGAFTAAIRRLLDDAALRLRLGEAGRRYALENWERNTVLERACTELKLA
jgi:colanic acid biosynthesis glycosyl transferase WcaI